MDTFFGVLQPFIDEHRDRFDKNAEPQDYTDAFLHEMHKSHDEHHEVFKCVRACK